MPSSSPIFLRDTHEIKMFIYKLLLLFSHKSLARLQDFYSSYKFEPRRTWMPFSDNGQKPAIPPVEKTEMDGWMVGWMSGWLGGWVNG